MKNYNVPEIELLKVNALDVIQTSPTVQFTNPNEMGGGGAEVVPSTAYSF